jgi:hypothetical protein
MVARPSDDAPAGAATDALGRAALDPTKNVLDLVDAAIQRQDDLREIGAKHQDELREMTAQHQREMATVRHDYERELRQAETSRIDAVREAETARIDAIRAVDVGAVNRAAEVAATAATTLAAQVTTSAETLRVSVQTAATAAGTQLAASLEPIIKDIADLRKTQYEQAGGKAQVSESREVSTGTRSNMGLIIAAAGVVSAAMLGAAGIVITLLLRLP